MYKETAPRRRNTPLSKEFRELWVEFYFPVVVIRFDGRVNSTYSITLVPENTQDRSTIKKRWQLVALLKKRTIF